MTIASGQTQPGDWVDYGTHAGGVGDGIGVEVDTSAARFRSTPHYIFTLEGNSPPGGMWRVAGINAVYNPTPTGFQIYLCWADTKWGGGPNTSGLYPNPITAAAATNLGWFVKWTGIENP